MCCRGREEEKALFNKNNRRCTDLLALLFFLVAIGGSIWCILDADKAGADYKKTIYGVDYNGNICGHSAGFEDRPYSAWPILPLAKTLDANTYFKIKTCVASCDETNTDTTMFKELYQSKPVFKYCFPISDKTIETAEKLATSSSEQFGWLLGDIMQVWPVIIGACGVAAILSLFYIVCMRCKCIRSCMVWLSILALIAGGVAAGTALLYYAKSQTDSGVIGYENRTLAAKILGWVLIGLSAIFFLIVIFLRKKIAIALEIMGAASQALGQMCSLFLYPIIPTILLGGFAVYWVYGAITLFSVKIETLVDVPTDYKTIPAFAPLDKITSYVWDTKYQYMFIYFSFFLFWGAQFIVYASLMTMAGAVANWYYSEPTQNPAIKQKGSADNQLSRFPVAASGWRVFRYHLGTVAFASFILAVIMMIRAVVMYIQKRTRKQQNGLVRCLFRIVNCCLKCCHSCLDFLSRNALIWCAIRGESFCESAFNSFGCLMKDLRLTIALNAVGSFIIFVGKFTVALLSTGAAGFAMWGIYDKDDLSSNVLPLVIVFVLSYLVASIFMEVYDSVVDTVFICYVADTDKKYASDKLKKSADKLREHENQEHENKISPDNNNYESKTKSKSSTTNYSSTQQYSNYNQNNNSGYGSKPASGSAGVSYI